MNTSILKNFEFEGTKIEYTHIIKPKNKTIKITIKPDGKCTVVSSKKASDELINKFINSKKEWIVKKILEYKNNPRILLGNTTKKEFNNYKFKAFEIINERLVYYNKIYNYSWQKIGIRNQSTRWGSCSSKKNLNFNYKIVYLPKHLVDYIVVHELCHLKEMNHSKRFWDLVSMTIPNHNLLRKELFAI